MGALPGRFQYLLDMQGKPGCRLGSVDLPRPMTQAVMGTFHQRVHPVETPPITLGFDAGVCAEVTRWIADTINRRTSRRNGAITVLNGSARPQSRIEFYDALITEVTIPAVAASMQGSANLLVQILPERTVTKAVSSFDATALTRYGPASARPWNTSRFRLSIDGLEKECAAVTRIDSLAIRQGVKKLSVGERRIAQLEPTRVSESSISLSLPTASAGGFNDWLRRTTTEATPFVRNASVQYLVPGKTTSRFEVRLYGVRLVKLTTNVAGSPNLTRAELVFDRLAL